MKCAECKAKTHEPYFDQHLYTHRATLSRAVQDLNIELDLLTVGEVEVERFIDAKLNEASH